MKQSTMHTALLVEFNFQKEFFHHFRCVQWRMRCTSITKYIYQWSWICC